MATHDPGIGWGKTRPIVRGRRGAVACGHYLAAEIGIRILRAGGNAVDAGVAMVLAEAVLEFQSFGFGGEVPTLIYSAAAGQAYEVNGNMCVPQAATIPRLRALGYEMIPGDGFLPAGVCAVPDAAVNALDRFGTMTFAQVAEGAIEIGRDGYPMYEAQQHAIAGCTERFRAEWPTSAALFLPDDQVPEIGQIVRNPGLARTLDRLAAAETAARGDRHAGLMAARDAFYKGQIAAEIVAFQKEFRCRDAEGGTHPGLLELDDFAAYTCLIGAPVAGTYRGIEVLKCGPWTQGPVFLQHLNLLEGFDLHVMGHNSEEYVHTWIEAAKLAHADKEKYYGDPNFVHVPVPGLLSKEYAALRRQQIGQRASLDLIPGNPYPFDTSPDREPPDLDLSPIRNARRDRGTTGTRALDSAGNMFSATPSGGWFSTSPIIPGLGFCLGTRGQMFTLEQGCAKSLAGGKRPCTSLTPTLALQDGQPLMVFGMPGGDLQDQGTLSCFLNLVDFGMDLQTALDAPKFWTAHFPSLFYPHGATPGNVTLESRCADIDTLAAALTARGHKVTRAEPWTGDNTMICRMDRRHGVCEAAANPRFTTSYALAW